jgi:hypothetical protein
MSYAIVQRSAEYPTQYEVVVADEVVTYSATQEKGEVFLGKILPLISGEVVSPMAEWDMIHSKSN